MKRFRRWFNTPFGRVCGSVAIVVVLAVLAFTGFAAYWVSTSGLLTSGAYVCASNAGTVHLNMAKIFHGVYGDRVGWCDGTDDQAEIQSAIDTLTLGGRLVLSSGTFTVNQTSIGKQAIIPDVNKFKISGQGASTIIRAAAGFNGTIIGSNCTDALRYQMVIADLFIDGNKANQATQGYGINMTGWNDSRIVNVNVWNVKTDGIYANGTDNTSTGNRITNSTISACNGSGVYYTFCYGWTIADSWVGSCSVAGIRASGGGEASIDNTIIDQCARGIYIYGTDELRISNSPYIGANTKCGIDIDHTAYDVTVTNCLIQKNGSDNTNPCGISVGASTRRTKILGNTINDEGLTYQDYGIKIASGANQTMIHDNNLLGNYVAAILDSGAVNESIQSNMGWITELEGSSSIASGDTTKVVTHGLSATPTYVWIAFKEQGTADYGRWWVSSVNATAFTLNVSADPGASNLDFYWRCLVR